VNPAPPAGFNISWSRGDNETMSENSDLEQDIPTPRGAGRTTTTRKPRRKEVSRKKRQAYFKAVEDIKGEGHNFALFQRCPLCGKVA